MPHPRLETGRTTKRSLAFDTPHTLFAPAARGGCVSSTDKAPIFSSSRIPEAKVRVSRSTWMQRVCYNHRTSSVGFS